MASAYVTNPSHDNFKCLKRILRYCKSSINHGIVLGGNNNLQVLVGYADADWSTDPDTRKSRTGYTFHLNIGCITWQSKKQATVALSTSEAEYMSLASATQELKWLRCLLDELGFPQDVTEMNEDNRGCILFTEGNTDHRRTKHIDMKHHFVRDEIAIGTMKLNWSPTNDMLADIMTKVMPAPRFLELRHKLNIISEAEFIAKRPLVTMGPNHNSHIKEAVRINMAILDPRDRWMH